MNTVNVKVNFSEIDGFIKLMHSVNIDGKDAEEYKLYVGFFRFYFRKRSKGNLQLT